MHPVKSVFRCILRHANFLGDAALRAELPGLKARIRQHCSAVKQRQRIADLFMLEKGLRDVCLGRSTMDRVRSIMGVNDNLGMTERNQDGSYPLYMQHPMRRFDAYNKPPAPGSHARAIVHRRSKFANAFFNFAHKYNSMPKVHPDAGQVSNEEARRWSVTMGTILAPYMALRASQKGQNKRIISSPELTMPRPPPRVQVKTVERNSSFLPVLQISGSSLPLRGFKRFLAAANEDTYTLSRQLDEQIRDAAKRTQDPLDGETARARIGALRAEKAQLRARTQQFEQRLEVQRRILLRRRDELQRQLDWDHARRVQNSERRRKLSRPKMLTLDSL